MKQINSGLASYLKGLIKVHGLGRIAEGCGIDKELLELLATREKRSCTTEVYQKITELMAMDHSRLRKDEKE
jgi:hypothetical protein